MGLASFAVMGADASTRTLPVRDAVTHASPTDGGNVTTTITVLDQSSRGAVIEVSEATLADGGFVVVYRDSPNGTALGASRYLAANRTHRNVEVRLDRPLREPAPVVAVAYRDANVNRTFDPGDDPYMHNGSKVVDTATFRHADPPPTPPVTPTATPAPVDTFSPTPSPSPTVTTAQRESTTAADGPGFGVGAVVIALLTATALSLRR